MYKKRPSIHYLISLRRSIAVMLIVISLLNSKSIYAQEAIDNEYRLIVVPTYPISEKFYITTYLGYVNNMDSKIISTYIGLPGLLVYKPKKNFQLQAGCFLVLNNDKSEINKDSKEMRYVLGEKINLPNTNDQIIDVNDSVYFRFFSRLFFSFVLRWDSFGLKFRICSYKE